MNRTRLDLAEEQIDERQDEVIALRFAFMALARALDEAGALPLKMTERHLGLAADVLRAESRPGPGDLSAAAALIDELRASVGQLR